MTGPESTDDAVSPALPWLKRSRLAWRRLAWVGPPTLGLVVYAETAWRHIVQLDGATFSTTATLFWLSLIAGGLATVTLLSVALFARVEAHHADPRLHWSRAAQLHRGLALLISLLPAAWPASKAVRALLSGTVTIRQPVAHSFTAASDPLAYWQNVGFWLLATVALAGGALYYWRSRRVPRQG